MAVPRPFISAGKLLAGLFLALLSCIYRLPLIIVVGLAWYIWLRREGLHSRKKPLATFGLGFTAAGWGVSWFERYYGMKAEGSHFPYEGDDWMLLSGLSFWVGLGAMTLGLLALAYVDAFGVYPASPQDAQSEESAPNVDNIWPPAPKQPR
jgi:hypothetical protein